MILLDKERLLRIITTDHQKLFLRNKSFFINKLPEIVEQCIIPEARVKIYLADQPFKIDRCPKCKTPVVYGDNYCSSCGVKFDWR